MNALADALATWASYRPSDFLMFSPRTYWQLVAGLNHALWPLQVAWLLAGIGAAVLLLQRHRWAARALCTLLAAACAATALSWHLQRYAGINSGAAWLAAAFFAQAVLLLLAGWRGKVVFGRAGVGALLAALLVYPLLGALAGRPFVQAESFGSMPDPTLLAVLGGALLLGRWWLWPLPLAGCALAGTALQAMNEPLAPLLPAAALAALSAAAFSARRARSGAPPAAGQRPAAAADSFERPR